MKLVIITEDHTLSQDEKAERLVKIGQDLVHSHGDLRYSIDSTVTFATQGDLDRYVKDQTEAQRHEAYNAGKKTAVQIAKRVVAGEATRMEKVILEELMIDAPEEVGIPNVKVAKFAVGDTVRVIREGIIVPEGLVFEVEAVLPANSTDSHPYGDYYYTGKGAKSGVWEKFLTAHTPEPKFKKGDKVRTLHGGASWRGNVGLIAEDLNTATGQYVVKFDTLGTWNMSEDKLELASDVQIAKFAIGDRVKLVEGFGSVYVIRSVSFDKRRPGYVYEFANYSGRFDEADLMGEWS